MAVPEDVNAAKRRKLMMLAKDIGLNRDERVDLASMILRRDLESWNNLSDEQVVRMLDALEGFVLISYIRYQRAEPS